LSTRGSTVTKNVTVFRHVFTLVRFQLPHRVGDILRARFDAAREFLQKHSLEPGKNVGVDMSGLTEAFKLFSISLQAIENQWSVGKN
jgi:hypothetical protein